MFLTQKNLNDLSVYETKKSIGIFCKSVWYYHKLLLLLLEHNKKTTTRSYFLYKKTYL